MPILVDGSTALSVEISTKFSGSYFLTIFKILSVPKKLVYIDIFEKSWLYKLNMKTNKVIKHKKNIDLGKEYEIFKMDYSMLVALLTRHVVWTNIEEDIHYFRKPNTYDENLHFFQPHLVYSYLFLLFLSTFLIFFITFRFTKIAINTVLSQCMLNKLSFL